MSKKQEPTDMQNKIIEAYIKFVIKNKKHPQRKDMAKLGYGNNKIRRHFTSLTNLKSTCKRKNPEIFEGIIDEDLFTPKVFQKLKSEVAKYKRFIITTAVNGCDVHPGFLNSIETYCKENNAALLIIPSNDPAHNLDNKCSWNFDPVLADKNIVFNDLALNDKLHISSIKLGAKQIDPITGLDRLGQRNGSFIYASPKQRLKFVAIGTGKLPHALMTTGAITKPNYKTSKFMSERTAYIAENDHVVGAIVVEIVNKRHFHFRQIQANSQGYFVDLGNYYQGDKVTKLNPEAIVVGDWHSGCVDPEAKNAWFEVINELKPEHIVLHDIFSANSISHHDTHKIITKALKAQEGKLNLENEIRQVANDLNEFGDLAPSVVIVKSNHDEHLERYLQEGRYVDEPENHLVGVKLATVMLEGKDPLKWAVENIGTINNSDKFKWLKRDEEFRISKIHLGAHGDLGVNGSRGNIKSMETSLGACVTAHNHTAEILRQAWRVGTSTYLNLDYNKGASSWTHSSCLVYPNGSRQLINVIDGEWRMKDELTTT